MSRRRSSSWPWWAVALVVALLVLPLLFVVAFWLWGWNVLDLFRGWMETRGGTL